MRRDDVGGYLRSRFAPGERLAMVLIARQGPEAGKVEQKFWTLEQAASERVQAFLRHRNAQGWDIHASANPLKPGTRRRGKGDILEACWLWMDVDEQGERVLARIDADAAAGRLPPPTAVVNTSPGRYQVLWRIEPVAPAEAERQLRSLARLYGTDRAATDCNRVLRLPGFRSRKRDCEVRLVRHIEGPPARLADFPPVAPERDRPPAARTRTGSGRGAGGDRTRSGQDWAWTREQLRQGRPAAAVEAQLAGSRPDKAHPADYARRTVANAQRSLERMREGPSR